MVLLWMLRLPLHILIAWLRVAKATASMGLYVLILDHIKLQHEIYRHKYEDMYGKPYKPLYSQLLKAIGSLGQADEKPLKSAPQVLKALEKKLKKELTAADMKSTQSTSKL
eukprot:GILK01009122.1.p1 GENE.GILK01009122.1~~GILK01009122.1.p1  ORF type:complete len:111 (+),score=14.29 GILK01009122.1:44-376(+)